MNNINIINCKVTGKLPLAIIDNNPSLNLLKLADEEFCWSGCIDATHTVPTGSVQKIGGRMGAADYIKRS